MVRGAAGDAVPHRIWCFAPGTMVLMADRSVKAIEEITEGDYVLTDDPMDGEGPHSQRVTGVLHSSARRIVRIAVTSVDAGELLATGHHPFWTSRGWVNAEDLTTADFLNGDHGERIQISSIAFESRETKTFNLSVEKEHTFFVLVGQQPVLVHNTDPWDMLYSHPLSENPTLAHGPYAGKTVNEVAAIVRELGYLPEGLEMHAVRQATDGRWITLNNRTLLIAQRANIPSVHPIDDGAEGFNKLQANYTRSGEGGPLENPFRTCD
jgi:Pretoxin HINT domain